MMPPPPPPPPPPHVLENGRYGHRSAGKLPPPLIICLNIVNTVTQLLLGAIVCVAFFITNHQDFEDPTKQHIYLCVTGYIILMSQAVLTISPTSWSSILRLETKKTIHWIMQILGSILAVSGSIVKIVNVDNHFNSIHGTFGLLALVFTCLSLAGGIINLFSMSASRIDPNFFKIGHSCFGCLTIIFAFLALTFAFDKTFNRFNYNDTNVNMMMAFTILALIGTLTPASSNIVRRFSK